MKRRKFLEKIGSTLGLMGVMQGEWLSLGNQHYQALADSSPRKLALLVGINQYPNSPALTGCLTDVELQRELLIHRFGFKASDILVLTEEQATRQSIETAFVNHLIGQAKPGDGVLFHFSGYGSRLQQLNNTSTLQNVLLPVDGEATPGQKTVNYLLEDTLLLLLKQLTTDRTIAVLDTSYYAPTRMPSGGLGIRTSLQTSKATLVEEELEFQKSLQKSVSLQNNSDFGGLLLTATSDVNQMAREVQLSGFSAGLFTYALTQYLWEALPANSMQVSISRVAATMRASGAKQQPALILANKNQQKSSITESFLPTHFDSAEGVVIGTDEDGKGVKLWLGGIPSQILESYGVGSRFNLIGDNGNIGLVTILRSRGGLVGKAQVFSQASNVSNADTTAIPKVGQLIQEVVRVLPRNTGLVIAFDNGLERIERVDATSAFANMGYVSTVVVGEQPADYIFGKLRETKVIDSTAITTTFVSLIRYGLFSLGNELLPNTEGEIGEAIKVAVKRLAPKIPTLVAAKLWRLTENEGSSRLPVKVSLEIVNGLIPRVISQRETSRVNIRDNNSLINAKKLATAETGQISSLPIGSKIQYRLQNNSDRQLYVMLLGVSSSGRAMALFPWQKNEQLNPTANLFPFILKDIVVEPGQSLLIPPTTGFELMIQQPTICGETQLIFSTAPFTLTLAALQAGKTNSYEQERLGKLTNPMEVAQALLQDLHNASAVIDINPAESYALDVNQWASFSFVYEVV
jgi:Caspase domain/Domain of unknown function (DUF4384)